jgi:hypothetical protein
MFERGFMERYRHFTLFLILLLLLSTLVAVSHHHDGSDDGRDCPICIANNHQSATGPSTVAFDITPFLAETKIVLSVPALSKNLFVASRSTRGPPA